MRHFGPHLVHVSRRGEEHPLARDDAARARQLCQIGDSLAPRVGQVTGEFGCCCGGVGGLEEGGQEGEAGGAALAEVGEGLGWDSRVVRVGDPDPVVAWAPVGCCWWEAGEEGGDGLG